MIGYPSGTGGTGLSAQDYPLCPAVLPSLFGQDGRMLATFFFFCVLMDRDKVEVHK